MAVSSLLDVLSRDIRPWIKGEVLFLQPQIPELYERNHSEKPQKLKDLGSFLVVKVHDEMK